MPAGTDERDAIDADTRVGDLLARHPALLDVLVHLGFTPLRNPLARRAVAPLVTLRQAAAFRGLPLPDVLEALRRALDPSAPPAGEAQGAPAAGSEAPPEAAPLAPGKRTVPRFEGDLSFLGLVPCPIRNVLVEDFDAFAIALRASTGKRLAWWISGEGTATKDVLAMLTSIATKRQFERLPDLFTAVGKDIFLHRNFGRRFYDDGLWRRLGQHPASRSALAPLEDPAGRLRLLYVGLFVLVCHEANLRDGVLPATWRDLAHPRYRGRIAMPSLDLPVIPDLLGALYHHLGADDFAHLAGNVARAAHPSGCSPREGAGDPPGVFVLPLHFARLGAARPGAVLVVPDEGPVAIPAFVAAKEGMAPAGEAVLDHLCAPSFQATLWRNGAFVANHEDVEVDLPLGAFVTRPWHDLLEPTPGAHTNQLVRLMAEGGRA